MTVHTIGEAIHVRLVPTPTHVDGLPLEGATGEVIPARDPADARCLVLGAREAVATHVDEAGASVGRATETRIRPRPSAEEARWNMLRLNGSSGLARPSTAIVTWTQTPPSLPPCARTLLRLLIGPARLAPAVGVLRTAVGDPRDAILSFTPIGVPP